MFKILDMFDERFPSYIFGVNKDGVLFINAQMTDINLNNMEKIGIIESMSLEEKYQELKKFLIKHKLIKE